MIAGIRFGDSVRVVDEIPTEREAELRAKEYAERYKAEGETLEALAKVFWDIFKEFKVIADQRKVTTDTATIAIYRELEQKWKAFARLVNCNPQGFRELIKQQMPELYGYIHVTELKEQDMIKQRRKLR